MMSMNETYQLYAKIVYRYLLSITGNDQIAEELTQETFYQAVKNIGRFDGSCQMSTWLCAIAKNQYRVYQRKHPPAISIEDEKINTIFELNHQISSAETKVIDEINRIELMKKIHACEEPFREILYLRIFGNLSFKEIGEVLGKTENWARVTYYRGKEKLRKELEKNE